VGHNSRRQRMSKETVTLPDGTSFPFWGDETRYTKTYHVACGHAQASDENPGTDDRPFKTISRAAEVLEPGEKVIVHEGVYRECVRPARGGEGPDRMIAYEAVPGETVVVKGSEVWEPELRPSEGWSRRRHAPDVQIWMADLPAEWFVGYNPFLANNVFGELMTFNQNWSRVEMQRLQLRRGMMFLDGRPLKQVFRPWELAEYEGAFWVEGPGLRIHLRLWEDADPNGMKFEVTTREQILAPLTRRLGYIRVKGFRFEHAADGVPIPQRAALSASQGHHWIIEDNVVRFANACGIDVGRQHWHMSAYTPCGNHIIRRNRISDCGICGIAGVNHVDHTLVDGNVVERIGGLDIERLYECAGMKFHGARCMLIRRNVFRDISHASGLWLDFLNENSRVTGNVFCDISSFSSALHLEVSHQVNLIDRNLFWDIRGEPWDKGNPHAETTGGHGIKADSCEYAVAAHNFFGQISDGYALYFTVAQNQREVGGRTGLSRRLKVLNNILVQCPKRVCMGRREENVVDGNLYDAANDRVSLMVEAPPPKASQNLRGWREFFGFDLQGAQAKVAATFDAEKLELSFQLEGEPPESREVEQLHVDRILPCGPFDDETWAKVKKGQQVKIMVANISRVPSVR
jgi:hypothetical protein